jgi:hypothetical protein
MGLCCWKAGSWCSEQSLLLHHTTLQSYASNLQQRHVFSRVVRALRVHFLKTWVRVAGRILHLEGLNKWPEEKLRLQRPEIEKGKEEKQANFI